MWVRNHRQRNRPARSSEYKRLVHVIGGDAYAHESLAPHVTGMRLIMGITARNCTHARRRCSPRIDKFQARIVFELFVIQTCFPNANAVV